MLLATPGDTQSWGRAYAADLAPGDVVLLFGPLGAGKTTLVQGLAAGLGYGGEVVSPTYTLMEVYDARCPLYHFDFYRIDKPEALRTLDPREYFDSGVCFVEWPERIRALWPARRREIHLAFAGTARELTEQSVTAG